MFSHCERQLFLIRCLNAQMFWMRNQDEALGWWQRQQEGQYEPVNCRKISRVIKLHSAILCVQDDLILTYTAIISCSPVSKRSSYESLLDPFVGKERVHRSWVFSKPGGVLVYLLPRRRLSLSCQLPSPLCGEEQFLLSFLSAGFCVDGR